MIPKNKENWSWNFNAMVDYLLNFRAGWIWTVTTRTLGKTAVKYQTSIFIRTWFVGLPRFSRLLRTVRGRNRNNNRAIANHIASIMYMFVIPVFALGFCGPGTKHGDTISNCRSLMWLLPGPVKHSVSVHVVCALRSMSVKRFIARSWFIWSAF